MSEHEGEGPAVAPNPAQEAQRARRTVGAFVVGAATVIWWPAFTLGAWGRVFFEQILLLWAAATAALLVVLFRQGGERPRGRVLATLLVPTLWIVGEFVGSAADNPAVTQLVRWFGAIVTVVGLPTLVWVLLRTVRPDLVEAVPARGWAAAAATVGIIAAVSLVLGWLNPHFLQCEDFTISGNSPPPGCTPAP
ncbi:hypothetical protein [Demequina soli]|uniref:hypothetical protein n=1 Tax=Demequina soli TaxID=1638987 RepID=UPI00078138B6|nr:hypothetical protein [Demequina soli]